MEILIWLVGTFAEYALETIASPVIDEVLTNAWDTAAEVVAEVVES